MFSNFGFRAIFCVESLDLVAEHLGQPGVPDPVKEDGVSLAKEEIVKALALAKDMELVAAHRKADWMLNMLAIGTLRQKGELIAQLVELRWNVKQDAKEVYCESVTKEAQEYYDADFG